MAVSAQGDSRRYGAPGVGAKRPVMDKSAPGGRTDMPRGGLGSQFDPKRKPSVQSSLMNHLFCDPD
jgi:hypothetical protein